MADVSRQPDGTERLGKYSLLHRLARGGMAEIFLARATGIEGFERLVVLKKILPQYAESARFIQMFLQEARLAATLHHSNIAQVYDIDCVAGTYVFAMEYVHGVDVHQISKAATKRGQPIPLEHAISIVVGTAAGLHYAHEKRDADGRPLGIVHRDVSPSNVLVGYDGGVKLVDFGIAKAASQREQTRPGALKGKVSCMSPEQCRGDELDRRSDVFALGILLYELTTGTLLFDGASDVAVIRQIVNLPVPPPSGRSDGYPPELERIVLRALSRSPDDRYQTAHALQEALEAFVRACQLSLSSMSLASYVQDLFGEDLDGWRRAEQAGVSLADFLASTASGTTVERGIASAGRTEPSGDDDALCDAPASLPRTDELTAAGAGQRAAPRRRARIAGVAALVAVAFAAGAWATRTMWRSPGPASVSADLPPALPARAHGTATVEPIAQPAPDPQVGETPATPVAPPPSTVIRVKDSRAARPSGARRKPNRKAVAPSPSPPRPAAQRSETSLEDGVFGPED